jgi:hypothetical protein
MNRENYNPKILSTFNIIGCYFVDYFYNHLYHRSKKVYEKYSKIDTEDSSARRGRERSFTDEYKKAAQIFREEVSHNSAQYKNVITRLHNYYQTTTKFSTILLVDFTNKILSDFVSDEHFPYMNQQERDYFLHKIIVNIVNDFVLYVTKIDTLCMVIDDHNNRVNVQKWIETIVNIQIRIRENLFHKFLSNGKSQTVEIGVFEKMQADRDKLWEALQIKTAEVVELKNNLANARKIVEHYSLECDRLSAELSKLRSEESVRKPDPPRKAIEAGARHRQQHNKNRRHSDDEESSSSDFDSNSDDDSNNSSRPIDNSRKRRSGKNGKHVEKNRRGLLAGKQNAPKESSLEDPAERSLIDLTEVVQDTSSQHGAKPVSSAEGQGREMPNGRAAEAPNGRAAEAPSDPFSDPV